jgi:hypothetical protein
MSETLSSDELAIGRLIRELADAETRGRDPDEVVRIAVAGARRPRRTWLRFAAGIAVLGIVGVAAVVAVSVLNPTNQGSSPATARVGGLTYAIAIGRSIDLSSAQLTPHDEARQDSGFVTADATAYQVDQLDPRQVLVMRLIPGEHDDAGSIGEFLLLIRGDGFSLLCDYWEPGDPLAPTVC